MLYIKLFIEREKNIGQSAPECPFNRRVRSTGGFIALPKKVTGEYFTRGNSNKLLVKSRKEM